LDSSQEKYATVDVGNDQYDKHLTVLMNASDRMHYMMLKASRPDFRDCRDVPVRLKEEARKRRTKNQQKAQAECFVDVCGRNCKLDASGK